MLDNTKALKTQLKELVKQHIEYDGLTRVEYVYTARQDCPDGYLCSVVRYAYDGVTNRVIFMKESNAVWNSAWELF